MSEVRMKTVYEQGLDKLLARLKRDNPNFDIQAELGNLLRTHIDDMTQAQKSRMYELKAILHKSNGKNKIVTGKQFV